MAELVDWLNAADDTPPLVRAAMAHLHLVSIHPWADGNGRMSRSLQTLLIAREGILAPEFSSIEAWLGRPGNTWEYYRELASRGATYQPAQDVSSWVRFNLVAYHQQAQAVRHRIDRSGRTWRLLADYRRADGTRRTRRLRAARRRDDRARPAAALRARRRTQPPAGPARSARPRLGRHPGASRPHSCPLLQGRPRFPQAALTEARTPMAVSNPRASQ